MKPKTILASCYAVNPYKGSEDGMGWNFIYQIARHNKVIAITRKNNRAAIEKYMQTNPDQVYQNISMLYFDLPYWMRFWKKGSRGAMLYYYLWQRGIVSFINKQKIDFDIAHNVNFHNDWTPSFLWKLDKPFVWGPIGHHPLIPAAYLKPYAFKYLLKDHLTWLVKQIFWNFSPSLKKTIQHAHHIFCMNSAVASSLKLKVSTYSIMPSVATEDYYEETVLATTNFHVIGAGRLVPLKGFDLSVHAFIKFIYALPLAQRKSCKLSIVGSGPEKELLEKIIEEHKVSEYIDIIEWMERKELMKLYHQSSVFLFPSHEGAGMVVAEALSFGLPVICLNNEGPGEFVTSDCGIIIKQGEYHNSINQIKDALQRLYFDNEFRKGLGENARKTYLEKFTWHSRGEQLNKIYNNL